MTERQGRRGSAIVFDPSTDSVSTQKVKKLKGKSISQQNAPKWNSHVDIYVDQDDQTKRLAARLNLDRLGWAVNVQRLCGKFRHIYVMELPDGTTSPMVQAA